MKVWLFLLFCIIESGQNEEIKHDLPEGLEIVDPKSLGLKTDDLDKLLGNVKLLPIASGKVGDSKTQILTVGFDGNEKLNFDDFELPPNFNLPQKDQEIAQVAFKQFQEYIQNKGNNNEDTTTPSSISFNVGTPPKNQNQKLQNSEEKRQQYTQNNQNQQHQIDQSNRISRPQRPYQLQEQQNIPAHINTDVRHQQFNRPQVGSQEQQQQHDQKLNSWQHNTGTQNQNQHQTEVKPAQHQQQKPDGNVNYSIQSHKHSLQVVNPPAIGKHQNPFHNIHTHHLPQTQTQQQQQQFVFHSNPNQNINYQVNHHNPPSLHQPPQQQHHQPPQQQQHQPPQQQHHQPPQQQQQQPPQQQHHQPPQQQQQQPQINQIAPFPNHPPPKHHNLQIPYQIHPPAQAAPHHIQMHHQQTKESQKISMTKLVPAYESTSTEIFGARLKNRNIESFSGNFNPPKELMRNFIPNHHAVTTKRPFIEVTPSMQMIPLSTNENAIRNFSRIHHYENFHKQSNIIRQSDNLSFVRSDNREAQRNFRNPNDNRDKFARPQQSQGNNNNRSHQNLHMSNSDHAFARLPAQHFPQPSNNVPKRPNSSMKQIFDYIAPKVNPYFNEPPHHHHTERPINSENIRENIGQQSVHFSQVQYPPTMFPNPNPNNPFLNRNLNPQGSSSEAAPSPTNNNNNYQQHSIPPSNNAQQPPFRNRREGYGNKLFNRFRRLFHI